MEKHQVLYSTAQPVDGSAALNATSYSTQEGSRGLVPYFVSGPLSRSGMVGFVGTALHVAAWLCAVIFDMILFSQINYEKTPGAFTFCLWGFVSLVIGFVALVGVTLMHAFSSENTKIPEGGAPPFLMTMFIGGAQISLILTILQLIAMLTVPKDADSAYVWIDMSALADGETRDDKINALRNLNVWTMISKVYIVQFLKNNQEWAGPANELKKQAAIGIGPRRKDGTFAQARM